MKLDILKLWGKINQFKNCSHYDLSFHKTLPGAPVTAAGLR
jgi:hypothetical protein